MIGVVLSVLYILSPYLQGDCEAAYKRRQVNRVKSSSVASIMDMRNYASLVVNYDTGKVIHQVNAHEIRHPASLTKMMTLFVVFDALKTGRLRMDQKLPISAFAARQACSCLPIQAGEMITVKDAIYGAIVKSANNATCVLGEAIAGNTQKFVMMMNKKAKQLGMANTRFVNTNGLPDPRNVSTAYDMARLAIALQRDHSEYYHLFSTKSFKFKGQEIVSHNRVMHRYPWADGLKTGYTKASGFNLATSTKSPDGNLVAVVMGGPTAKARDDHMISLLESAYKKMATIDVAQVTPADNVGVRRSIFSVTESMVAR